MGHEWIRRSLHTPGVLASAGPSTVTPADVGSGQIAMESNIKLSTESITGTDIAQTLSADGVSFVTYGTSGASNDILLPAPKYPGQVKEIFFTNDTTSVELNINTNATANTFWGTTWNTIDISAASTGSPGGVPAGTLYLKLVAHSTTQWAVVPGSTFNWDFSGSTGSTSDTKG